MAKPGEPPDSTLPTVEIGAPKSSDVATVAGVAPPISSPSLPRGTVVGRYIILEPLGEGGMGVVYTAHDPELDRRVALKLLRPEDNLGESGSVGRGRLAREAHAMARLNHPNVVAIHDSGIYGDLVFLAVELVEGMTVKTWLAQAPRSWQEILKVFLQAGRGLTAAHAAGLVHLDFKPANILLGADGVAKVTDFGLARAAGITGAVDPNTQASSPDLLFDPTLANLTRPGVVSGTPAYMAPERILGESGDARTDEFSFSITLYHALYGELPFETGADRSEATPIRPPPKGTRVPAWIRRPLLRGLSRDPNDRYPTLTDLLDALQADPAVGRRKVLTLASLALVILATAAGSALLVLRQRAAADPCHDPAGKLAGVWDDTVRSQVHAAFAAAGGTDAAGSAAYAEKAMDRAANAWLGAYRETCDATRVRHTQPESALNLRLDCLAEQRLDLRAAVELLSHPDASKLTAAIGAASNLPLPLLCSDARALSVIVQPSPEHRAAVDSLRLQLARGRALNAAGKHADAIEVLKSLPDEAHALDASALEAQALLSLGAAYHNRGAALDEQKKAVDLDLRAADLAERSHMDELATEASTRAAENMALLGSLPADVNAVLDRARLDLGRVGAGGLAEFTFEDALGIIETVRGHNAEGARHGRRALALADQLYGNDRSETMNAANDLAAALEPLGQYEELPMLCRRAIAVVDSIMGPNNPRAILPQVNLAEIWLDLGKLPEADQALSQLFARIGVQERAEAAVGLAVQAVLRAKRGQTSESLKDVQSALALAAKLGALESPNWTDIHRYVVEADLLDGRPAPALAEYLKYLAPQQIAADSPGWVAFLRLGGWAHLDAGQPEQALPILERALKLSAAHPFYPGWVARLRYQTAQALVQTHGDRARAETLAHAAHDELVQLPAQKDLLAEVDAWRAKTFGPR